MFFSNKIRAHKYEASSEDKKITIRPATEEDWEILSEYFLNNTLPEYRDECSDENYIKRMVRMESKNVYLSLIDYEGKPIGEVKIHKHSHFLLPPAFVFNDPPLKNKKIYHLAATIFDKNHQEELSRCIELGRKIIFEQMNGEAAVMITEKDDKNCIGVYENCGFTQVKDVVIKKRADLFQEMVDNCYYYYYLKDQQA